MIGKSNEKPAGAGFFNRAPCCGSALAGNRLIRTRLPFHQNRHAPQQQAAQCGGRAHNRSRPG